MRKNRSFSIAFGGFSCSFTVILLFIASISPTGTLGLTALAGLCPYIVQMVSGAKAGILSWISSFCLSFILLPQKIVPILFFLCFGFYPLCKEKLEQKYKFVAVCILKTCYANVSFIFSFLLLKQLLFPLFPSFVQESMLLLIVGNLYFWVYDYGLSQLFPMLTQRLKPFLP